ncbi:MAG: hypothetical protein HZB91_13055 [Elusimicrobia bacterium]|nr:hypothetical protein [Elusimicrobiota bacterium]
MITTWVRLKALLADERGTMIEIPITIALVCVVLAVAVNQPTLGRAALAAVIAIAAFLGGLALLVGIGFLLGRVSEIRWVNAFMDSRPVKFFAEWLPWLLLSMFTGAAGAFFGLVIAEAANQAPAGQVKTGIISGLVLAALPLLCRLWQGRGKKMPPRSDGPQAQP